MKRKIAAFESLDNMHEHIMNEVLSGNVPDASEAQGFGVELGSSFPAGPKGLNVNRALEMFEEALRKQLQLDEYGDLPGEAINMMKAFKHGLYEGVKRGEEVGGTEYTESGDMAPTEKNFPAEEIHPDSFSKTDLVQTIVQVANALDEAGMSKEADIMDKILTKVSSLKK